MKKGLVNQRLWQESKVLFCLTIYPFEDEQLSKLHIKCLFLPHREQNSFLSIKNNQWILFREIIALDFKNLTKLINTENLTLQKTVGTYTYPSALNSYKSLIC
jgi:hypothetical protein